MSYESVSRCPYCGRCISKVFASDRSGKVDIIKDIPEEPASKTFYHKSTCPRCRKPVVVSLKFAS